MGLAAAKAKGVKLGDPNIKAAQEPAVAAVKAEADRAEQRHADHRRNPEVRRNDLRAIAQSPERARCPHSALAGIGAR